MSCAHLLRRRLCGTTPLLSSRSMLTTARAGTLQFDRVTHHALSTQASTAVDGVGVAGAASNIWVADVPVTKVKGLNTLHPYRRATRARFPNGDPELCTDCWHDSMKRWHPDLSCVGKHAPSTWTCGYETLSHQHFVNSVTLNGVPHGSVAPQQCLL